MATRTTYVKLGLFVVLAGGAVLLIGVFIGLHLLTQRVARVYTFFDEVAPGLDPGTPVRARGVRIGEVGQIRFAPDHRMVEVRSDLDVDAMEQLGIPPPDAKGTIHLPSSMRAQLASEGLTGGPFVAVDFFDEKAHPPPVLSFEPPENYLPAASTGQNTLEESVKVVMNHLAALLQVLRSQGTAEQIASAAKEANEVLALLERLLKNVDQQNLPQRTGATVEQIHQAAVRLNRLVDEIGGRSGLLEAAQESLGAVGRAGRSVTDTTTNLGETLEELRAPAAAIRHLADELERNPDMLLKGRGKEETP